MVNEAMTEVMEPETRPETPPIETTIRELVQDPPECLVAVLKERGHSPDELEDYSRLELGREQQEELRQLMLRAASSKAQDDTRLASHLRNLLDPRERAWERLVRAQRTDEPISAMVVEAVKGGLVVDLGIRGFIPASHASLNQSANLQVMVGRTLPLKVLEINRKRQMAVLSHRKVLEEDRAVKRKETFQNLKVGEVKEGIVRRLSDIGAFVDVGGVDGLLHVSEIAWKPVGHPTDALKVGQKIDVLVQKVDPDLGKISLSIRRLTPDPWVQARKRYSLGKAVRGTVTETNSGGAVVELEGGFEGFIPMRELSDRRINSADEAVQVSQELDMVVLEMRDRDRKIVLSPRKAKEQRERKEVDSFSRRQAADDGRTTLGDLFGHLFTEQLAAFREEQAAKKERQKPSAAVAEPTPEAVPAAEREAAPVAEASAPEQPAAAEPVASLEPVAEEPAAAEALAALEQEAPAAESLEAVPPTDAPAAGRVGAAHASPASVVAVEDEAPPVAVAEPAAEREAAALTAERPNKGARKRAVAAPAAKCPPPEEAPPAEEAPLFEVPPPQGSDEPLEAPAPERRHLAACAD